MEFPKVSPRIDSSLTRVQAQPAQGAPELKIDPKDIPSTPKVPDFSKDMFCPPVGTNGPLAPSADCQANPLNGPDPKAPPKRPNVLDQAKDTFEKFKSPGGVDLKIEGHPLNPKEGVKVQGTIKF